PVVGYQTDELPAFYSRSSGLKVDISADSAEEVAKIALAHWAAGLQSSILVVVPPPEDVALPLEKIEKIIQKAVKEAEEQGIHGAATTPFLLSRVTELSGGESLKTNFATLLNNGRIAAKIALHLKDKNLLDVRL
ncbi:MAG: pseudouridine-5'-phosphate glycosidase, partial [Anaerolineaceae bacterium]|nr:pseudouridine-5'-phosphate glycosidase [Anaerolineaceae bacterium]